MEACTLCREKYPGDGDRCEENRKPVPDEPGEAAKERAEEKAAKIAEAEEAAKAAAEEANAPAEEAATEDAPAEEAAAEEATEDKGE